MRSLAAVAAAMLAFSGPAVAQTEIAARPLDLVEEVRGLEAEIRDLTATIEDLAGPGEDLTAAVENLQVTETETEIKIALSGDVLFDFDKADIRNEAEPVLGQVIELLRQHRGAAVTIAGYTDAKGSDSYNLKLSKRRAEAVRRWLSDNGGPPRGKIRATGYGEADPVAPNQNADGSDNPEGRQQNRRVEIEVSK